MEQEGEDWQLAPVTRNPDRFLQNQKGGDRRREASSPFMVRHRCGPAQGPGTSSLRVVQMRILQDSFIERQGGHPRLRAYRACRPVQRDGPGSPKPGKVPSL